MNHLERIEVFQDSVEVSETHCRAEAPHHHPADAARAKIAGDEIPALPLT